LVNFALLGAEAILIISHIRNAEKEIARLSEKLLLQKLGLAFTVRINLQKLIKRAGVFEIDPAFDVSIARHIVTLVHNNRLLSARAWTRTLIFRIRGYDIGEIHEIRS